MPPSWVHLVVIGVWLATAQPAQAYLDAGSFSVLFQAAGASIFTAWFVLKGYRAKLRARLTGHTPLDPRPSERPGS